MFVSIILFSFSGLAKHEYPQDSTPCTLVEFLANNEGKRCVVVLDVSVIFSHTCVPVPGFDAPFYR